MSEDERQIRDVVAKWMEASKAGDTATVLSLMSDDVIFMVPGKEPFGKETFAANSKTMAGAKSDGKSDIVELKVLGDWAWLRNKLEVTITRPDGQTVTRSGYTLTIFKKSEQGRWLLTRDANLL